MKNYGDMSDFEINVMVFETLHGGSPDYRESDCGGMIIVSEEHEIVGGRDTIIVVDRGLFSPCNSWADAGPIIEEQRIRLIPVLYSSWIAEDYLENISAQGRNPLRLAMEVFLMMQEKK